MNAEKSSDGIATLTQCERTDALLAAAVRMIAAAGVGESPRLDALLLLSHATERPHSSFLAFPERAVPRDERLEFAEFVERRVRGEPVAYIVGSREFFSLPLVVKPDVLIPRPETELLVEAALARCESLARPRCSTSARAAAPSRWPSSTTCPDARVTGLDVSPARSSRRVRMKSSCSARWTRPFVGSRRVGSKRLPAERFDSIVSNPPYVRTAEVVGRARRSSRGSHSMAAPTAWPRTASCLPKRASRLNGGGALLVEHGVDQRPDLVALAAAHGWRVAAAHDDLAGRPRVLELERSSAS